MKRTVSLILVLAIILSIFAVIPEASAAKKKKEKLAKHYYAYTQTGKPLNLRAKADIKSKSLLKIPFGDEFYVQKKVNDEWFYGHWGGEFGYVRARNLVTKKPKKPTPKPTAKPTKKPSKPTAKPTKKPAEDDTEEELRKLNAELKSEREVEPYYIVVRPLRATGWVNFRVGPGTIATRITTFVDGKELKVIGETTRWYRAVDPETGRTGYINQNYTSPIEKEEETVAEVETDGKKSLGTLDVNGSFTLQCEIPEGYDLQVVNVKGDKVIASILPEDITKPQMYLSIAFDEAYADVDRMNDMSEEDLAVLEESFRQMNDVDISYRETGYGTKLLVAQEIGSDTDFVDFISVYKGYFIEFNMTPNPKTVGQTLTDEQIKNCIEFLTNLDFIPAEEEAPAEEPPAAAEIPLPEEAPAEQEVPAEQEAPAA